MMPSRRDVCRTGLITGFTLATGGAAASAIHTDETGLLSGQVHVPVSDGSLPAYRAVPAGPLRYPIIIVIEEIFGVHEYIKDVCRRWAKLGYYAIAPELYARQGDLAQYKDVQKLVQEVILKAPDGQLLDDLDHTLAWAAAQEGDGSRAGVMGFCRGGRDTWLFAEHSAKLRAAVAFYGPVAGPVSAIQPRNPVDLAAGLKCPLLGLYGGADDGIDPADVRRAAALAEKAGQTVEIKFFPGAPHGFHADYRPSYRPEAAREAWADAAAWFRKYGVA